MRLGNIHNILHGSYFCWCNGPVYHIMLQVRISYGYYIFEGGSYFFSARSKCGYYSNKHSTLHTSCPAEIQSLDLSRTFETASLIVCACVCECVSE